MAIFVKKHGIRSVSKVTFETEIPDEVRTFIIEFHSFMKWRIPHINYSFVTFQI
jgi:hypothetical protein